MPAGRQAQTSVVSLSLITATGGDLFGPQNLKWGTVKASVPLIFWEVTVIECEAKYELSKKGFKEKVAGSEIEVLGEEKGYNI